MDPKSTAVINGREVKAGDTIVTFRGEHLTFKYVYGGKVYTEERLNGLYPSVFPDNVEGR